MQKRVKTYFSTLMFPQRSHINSVIIMEIFAEETKVVKSLRTESCNSLKGPQPSILWVQRLFVTHSASAAAVECVGKIKVFRFLREISVIVNSCVKKYEQGMNGGVCKILCYFSRFWQIVDIGAFRPVLHLNFLLTCPKKYGKKILVPELIKTNKFYIFGYVMTHMIKGEIMHKNQFI